MQEFKKKRTFREKKYHSDNQILTYFEEIKSRVEQNRIKDVFLNYSFSTDYTFQKKKRERERE